MTAISLRLLAKVGFIGALTLSTGTGCGGSSSPPSGEGGAPPPAAWVAAVGAQGSFVQTFDDVSWTDRAVASGDLYAVTCFGNLDGWAAGASGVVEHTTDGGRTWTSQDTHTLVSLRAIRFGSANLGVVAGDRGTLAVTNDAGAHWTTATAFTAASLRGVAIASNAGVILAVGDGGVVLRSADEGARFTRSVIDGAGDLRSVASDADARRILAVDSLGGIWSSPDAGAHFTREATASDALDAIALSDDGTLAIAVGAHGTVLERAGVAAWQPVSSGTNANLHAAVIVGEGGNRHYVAGDWGTLLESVDRGVHWTAIAVDTRAPLYSLDDL